MVALHSADMLPTCGAHEQPTGSPHTTRQRGGWLHRAIYVEPRVQRRGAALFGASPAGCYGPPAGAGQTRCADHRAPSHKRHRPQGASAIALQMSWRQTMIAAAVSVLLAASAWARPPRSGRALMRRGAGPAARRLFCRAPETGLAVRSRSADDNGCAAATHHANRARLLWPAAQSRRRVREWPWRASYCDLSRLSLGRRAWSRSRSTGRLYRRCVLARPRSRLL
jgi:hypothetical protein